MKDKRQPEVGTKLDTVAAWCTLITVWGPIIAIGQGLSRTASYQWFLTYREVVFAALLVQLSARLTLRREPSLWKTLGLGVLGLLHNPIVPIHFGVVWPWVIVNRATATLSFWSTIEVADAQRRRAEMRLLRKRKRGLRLSWLRSASDRSAEARAAYVPPDTLPLFSSVESANCTQCAGPIQVLTPISEIRPWSTAVECRCQPCGVTHWFRVMELTRSRRQSRYAATIPAACCRS